MLCVLLLQQNEYSTLQHILTYATSIPESYPLVPSNLSEIISYFTKFTKLADSDPLYMDSRYPMPKMYGIITGKILGNIYRYLALLVYRLYSIVWYISPEFVLDYKNIPNTLRDLNNLDENLNVLLYWIELVENDDNLMEVINITNFQSRLNELRNSYRKITIKSPKEIVASLKEQITKKQQECKQSQSFDELKIKNLFTEIEQNIDKGLEPIRYFLTRNEQNQKFNLNSSSSHIFPTEAFIESPSISYVDIDSYVSSYTLHKFYDLFASCFYIQYYNNAYNLNSSDLFKALDKLAIDDKFIIITFDIYLDYYLGKIENFEKQSDFTYCYNNIQVINIPCNNRVFSQIVYIMKQVDVPKLSFVDQSISVNGEDTLRNEVNDNKIRLSIRRANAEDIPENGAV